MVGKMNEAISYIEEQLLTDLDDKTIARIACCSDYHFKRMFSFMAGVTLSEYIRRRRMTLAGLELKDSQWRVLDMALKYGYRSSDSFSRAFQSVHGVTPTEARKSEVSLKAYPRLTFYLSILGDEAMNFRLVEKSAFTVVGMKESIDNQGGSFEPKVVGELSKETYCKLEALADTELSETLHVSANVNDEKLDYYVAVATTKECPDEFLSLAIPATTWAVFEAVGPVPEATLRTWERIYAEWFPTSGYELSDAPEFIRPLNDHEEKSEIWIPVVTKKQTAD